MPWFTQHVCWFPWCKYLHQPAGKSSYKPVGASSEISFILLVFSLITTCSVSHLPKTVLELPLIWISNKISKSQQNVNGWMRKAGLVNSGNDVCLVRGCSWKQTATQWMKSTLRSRRGPQAEGVLFGGSESRDRGNPFWMPGSVQSSWEHKLKPECQGLSYWASYLTSLCPKFFFCKLRTVILYFRNRG